MDAERAPNPQSPGERLAERLRVLIARSRVALAVERAWPLAWAPVAVILSFLAFSWLGGWGLLPGLMRLPGLALFAFLLSASLWRMRGQVWPAERAAIDRLDAEPGQQHRPVTALKDELAVGADDPTTQALWQVHLRRMEAQMATARVSAPQPRMAEKDWRALRFVPALAAVVGLFAAGPDAGRRLAEAIDWRGALPPAAPIRIDGWIDPPGYTRLPPIMLDVRAAGGEAIRAPVGSTLVLRVAGQAKVEPRTEGGLKPATPSAETGGAQESRFTITGDGSFSLTGTGAPTGVTRIAAVPDLPPRIAFVEAPRGGDRGSLTVTYKATDDYGIAAVEALIAAPKGKPGARPLIEAPRLPLTPPAADAGEQEVKAILEMADHPWAGARVAMTLLARDDANQEGRSEAREVTLPQRSFSKPLAKALIEQRRKLVMDVNDRRLVQEAFDALLISPSDFMPQTTQFLALRMIAERLRKARNDAQLIEVVELIWAIAVQMEDGDLSDAERRLQAAQEKLQQALERGASEEEIRKLTEELRRAMDQYMREFAQRMEQQLRDNPQNAQRLPDNMRQMTPRDMNDILKRIEELARRGDTEEAQRLLEQLKEAMKNLQMGRQQQGDQRRREMGQAMEDLDRMTREQQELRDETFQQDQQGRRNQRMQRPGQRQQQQPGQGQRGQRGQQGQQGEQGDQDGDDQQEGQDGEGQEGMENQQGQQGQRGMRGQRPGGQGTLEERQRQLRDRFGQLQRRMRGMGAPNSEALGEADQAMGEAERALGQGRQGDAADAQGRALDAMRRGAEQFAQQMQRQPGEGEGEGDGTENAMGGEPDPQNRGRADSRQQQGNNDPLGRPQRGRDWGDNSTRVPGADASPQERARRVLEELRRRLGEPLRPQQELDYLERLLRRN